jgi:hypothetical protein
LTAWCCGCEVADGVQRWQRHTPANISTRHARGRAVEADQIDRDAELLANSRQAVRCRPVGCINMQPLSVCLSPRGTSFQEAATISCRCDDNPLSRVVASMRRGRWHLRVVRQSPTVSPSAVARRVLGFSEQPLTSTGQP